jgi:hypothetical protein
VSHVLRATCYVLRALTSDVRRALTCDVRWIVLIAFVAPACGDSPAKPGPIVPPPVLNNPPTVDSISLSANRVEADTEIAVTAAVRDTETPVDQLAYAWAADAGTFSGTGASVRWRAPKGSTSTTEYTLRLTVTETYGTASSTGTRPQHVVNATSAAVRVHDSPAEIGALAVKFLQLFATSSIGSDFALQDFSDSCSGKRAEKGDIDDNRRDFSILTSSLNLTSARVTSPWSRGDAKVRCAFSSRRLNCPAGSPASCRVGDIESVAGDCNLTAVYEQQRWFLCESTFSGSLLPVYGFFGRNR